MVWRLEGNSLVCTRYEIIDNEINYFQHRVTFDGDKIEMCTGCAKGCVFLVNHNDGYVVHSFNFRDQREVNRRIKDIDPDELEVRITDGDRL